jgi:hypothetical protein
VSYVSPALVAPAAPVRRAFAARRNRVLGAVVLTYPLWWLLGASYFVWPLLTFPLLLALLARPSIRVPPGFGIWVLFLAWMLLSGTQLSSMSFAFVWRVFMYGSATILFLYVFNASRSRLPDSTVVLVLAAFWVEVIVAGLAGVVFPHVTFHTVTESIVPFVFLDDQLVRMTVHPGLADVMTILGYPVGRPKALFAYTNQWGACAALVLPFAIAALSSVRRPSHRRILVLSLALAVIPLVVSLNRGVWITLGIALAYVALRLARPSNGRALVAGVVGLMAAAALVYATPLATLAQDRVRTESASTNTRLNLYAAVREQVTAAPLLGKGSPSVKTRVGSAPPVGTQGQLPLLAYSHGVPGLVLFLAFFGYSAVRSGRLTSPVRFWAHVAIVVALLLMPYYSLMPVALHILMVATALAWRDVLSPAPAG